MKIERLIPEWVYLYVTKYLGARKLVIGTSAFFVATSYIEPIYICFCVDSLDRLDQFIYSSVMCYYSQTKSSGDWVFELFYEAGS